MPEFNNGRWFKRGVVTACIRMVLNLGLVVRHARHARLLQRRFVPEFNTVCWFKRGVGVGRAAPAVM
ncbi:MAG: hypothetical protein C0463_01015 [Idiomarina sp.]|nr:hypothetical protein [Idiomarina sp.]MCL5050935.1 hypothetical protein [Bacillota bacterium]